MEPTGPLGAQRAPGQAVRGAGTPGDLMLTCFSEPTVRTLEDGQRYSWEWIGLNPNLIGLWLLDSTGFESF